MAFKVDTDTVNLGPEEPSSCRISYIKQDKEFKIGVERELLFDYTYFI